MGRATVTRLGVFVLVIAGSFGTAYGVGQRLPGNPESGPHTHGTVAASPVSPGFTVDGYVLVIESNRSSASALAFHVNGPDGQRIIDFTEQHGSRLHVVLIRPDLSGFRHVHPEIAADGSFVVPIDEPGKWHIVIDAQPEGAAAPIALATNVDDEVVVDAVELPSPDDEVDVDDLVVVRDGLNFTVRTKDGFSAQGLEPYLGQSAHLIAIRQGDLAYAHMHPVDDASATYAFHGSLSTGTYRLFLQFGYHGQVLTVPFTVVQQ
jgi:hypothetical protein